MNASDRLNTCKSRGNTWSSLLLLVTTGGWVSNAYATCLSVGDNPEKSGLIPHTLSFLHGRLGKDLLLRDRHAFH